MLFECRSWETQLTIASTNSGFPTEQDSRVGSYLRVFSYLTSPSASRLYHSVLPSAAYGMFIFLFSGSQSVFPAQQHQLLASAGHVLEMEIPRPTPDLGIRNPGVSNSSLYIKKPSGRFWCTFRFENPGVCESSHGHKIVAKAPNITTSLKAGRGEKECLQSGCSFY